MRALLALLLVVAPLGCVSGPQIAATSSEDGIGPVDIRRLADLATRELRCPKEVMRGERLGRRLYAVGGCERAREYVWRCSIRPGLYYSVEDCRWVGVGSLAQRAAFDFECPAHELKQVLLGEASMGVTGCGRKGVYVLGCDAASCSWVLNSSEPSAH